MKIFWPTILQMDLALDIATWEGMTRALTSKGHDVKLLVSGEDTDNHFKGECVSVPVIRKWMLRLLSYFVVGYFYFNYHFIKMRPDVVICDIFSFFFTFPWALGFGGKFGTKFVMDHRTFYFGSKHSLGERFQYYLTMAAIWYAKRFFNGMTAIVPFLKDQIVSRYRVEPGKIGLWSSGVDIDHFNPTQKAAKSDWMKDKFVVMQHGALSFNRGLLETVKAFKLIENSNICLVLVGKGVAEQKIRATIADNGLSERVKLLPAISHKNVPALISQTDLGILAYPDSDYWKGNNPIKLLEYMAMEKPIVCTDMITFRDVLSDSTACFYITSNTPKQIATAIETCYRRRMQIREACRHHRRIVLSRYTWDRQADNLIRHIDNI